MCVVSKTMIDGLIDFTIDFIYDRLYDTSRVCLGTELARQIHLLQNAQIQRSASVFMHDYYNPTSVNRTSLWVQHPAFRVIMYGNINIGTKTQGYALWKSSTSMTLHVTPWGIGRSTDTRGQSSLNFPVVLLPLYGSGERHSPANH